MKQIMSLLFIAYLFTGNCFAETQKTSSLLSDLVVAKEFVSKAYHRDIQLQAALECAKQNRLTAKDVTVYLLNFTKLNTVFKKLNTVFCVITHDQIGIQEVQIINWPGPSWDFTVNDKRSNYFVYYGNSYYFDLGAKPVFTLIEGTRSDSANIFYSVPLTKVEAKL